MKVLARLREWWMRTYGDAIARQRHSIEEDARRLRGTVIWHD